jgi:hypothetical protein
MAKWVSRIELTSSPTRVQMLKRFERYLPPFKQITFLPNFVLYKPPAVDFHEGFITIEKIIAIDDIRYLVKWASFDYSECT